jgi:hypothetical protein
MQSGTVRATQRIGQRNCERTEHSRSLERGAVMQENSEEWMQLCEQAAASEQDPEQLMTLVEQISVLIEAREQRLREGPSRPTAEAPKGSWPPLPH